MLWNTHYPNNIRNFVANKYTASPHGGNNDVAQNDKTRTKRKLVMEEVKKTIAIVCGGDSSEHDVSMRSAQGLYSFFDKERYNI